MALNKGFFEEIHFWHWKLRLTETIIRSTLMGGSKSSQGIAKTFGEELVDKIIRERNTEFMNWFYSFFEKYLLSRNWEKSLIEFIACAYYYPPEIISINMETDLKKNKLILYLDPEVSQNELYESWPAIKKELAKLNKGHRKNLSKKFSKNLAKLTEFSKLRGVIEYDHACSININLKDADIVERINPACRNNINKLKTEIGRLRVLKHRANKLQKIG
jgi:hypothetical protein